jgi:hypothetical protein
MKIKYAVLMLVAAFGLAANSFADEQPRSENQTQIIKVKAHGGTHEELTIESNSQNVKIRAHGETLADLKVADKGAITIRGGAMLGEMNKLRIISVNGGLISVEINCSGKFQMSFEVDEVEFNPGMRFGPTLAAQ